MKQTIPIAGIMLRLFIVATILIAAAFAVFGQTNLETFTTNAAIITTNAPTAAAVVAAAEVQTNLPPTVLSPQGGTPFDGNGLLVFIIPIAVPLLIGFIKFFIPKLPVWIIPLAAPFLGAALDGLAALALGNHASPLVSAFLGSAGVGLRELKDQLQQRAADAKSSVTVKDEN